MEAITSFRYLWKGKKIGRLFPAVLGKKNSFFGKDCPHLPENGYMVNMMTCFSGAGAISSDFPPIKEPQ